MQIDLSKMRAELGVCDLLQMKIIKDRYRLQLDIADF